VLVATTKVGEPKTVVCLEHMRTWCFEYLDFMGPKLQQFVLHNFVCNVDNVIL
jgi:hypothetical protein